MTVFVNSEIARKNRQQTKNRSNDTVAWRTFFIGQRGGREGVEKSPQAYLVEMGADAVIPPHFHQVDQFQVFVAGSGNLGRNDASLIALHYVDHHTAYGPVNAGPYGLSIFTFRSHMDPGAIYLDRPNYKDLLRPTKKRYIFVEGIKLSAEPVLESRSHAAWEDILGMDDNDGLGAHMLRLGRHMRWTGEDPGATAGQYYLVLNGSAEMNGDRYPLLSTAYVGPSDDPFEICASAQGVELLTLSFPAGE